MVKQKESKMKTKITENYDWIRLTTNDFTFTYGRNKVSCSGNISKATFENIADFVEKMRKTKNLGEIFKLLADEKTLASLIVETKQYSIGDSVNVTFGKHTIEGNIIDISKKYFKLQKQDGSIINVQKSILL